MRDRVDEQIRHWTNVARISATVNNSLSLHSSSSICEPSQRLVFLKEEIRAELIYYIFYAKRRVRLQTRQERA